MLEKVPVESSILSPFCLKVTLTVEREGERERKKEIETTRDGERPHSVSARVWI